MVCCVARLIAVNASTRALVQHASVLHGSPSIEYQEKAEAIVPVMRAL